MFCFELQRRATEAEGRAGGRAGAPFLSLAAHPGYASTNLQFAATDRSYEKVFGWIGNRLLAQSADMGALPTLHAATVPDLPGGTFVGPGGRAEQRGYPKVVTAARKAYQEQDWRRLWEVSEQLTGVPLRVRRRREGGVTHVRPEAARAEQTDLRAGRRRRARMGRPYLDRAGDLPGWPTSRRATFARSCHRPHRRPPSRSAPCSPTSTRSSCPGHALEPPSLFRVLRQHRSEPGILAELLTAALNVNAILWLPRRRRPSSRGSSRLAGRAARLPSGWHGHIEDTASTSTLAALTAARETTGGD